MPQPHPEAERKKALELAVSQIKKQFGDGAIMSLGKHSADREVSVIKIKQITRIFG
jgi:recombination protein RecA